MNDTVSGGDGDDLIYADGGNDWANGDNGNDKIFGRYGADTLIGGEGQDLLGGGNGNDLLIGGNGGSFSSAIAEDGGDILIGGKGDDTLIGGGNDVVNGGEGKDVYQILDDGSKGKLTIKSFNASEDKLQILYDPDQLTGEDKSKPTVNVVVINNDDTSPGDVRISFDGNVVAVIEGAGANLAVIRDNLELINASKQTFGAG